MSVHDETPAETIRRAIEQMRATAQTAIGAWSGEPWSTGQIGWNDPHGTTHDVRAGGSHVASAGAEELAAHIASWHPTVALAVADLLDHIYADIDNEDELADDDLYRYELAALRLARTYLGETP
jgi:hypothetical protein